MKKIDHFLRLICVLIIRSYHSVGKLFGMSSLGHLVGAQCRYYPSCSYYALESFQTRCFVQAVYVSTRRLLRCHPYGKGGYDPL